LSKDHEQQQRHCFNDFVRIFTLVVNTLKNILNTDSEINEYESFKHSKIGGLRKTFIILLAGKKIHSSFLAHHCKHVSSEIDHWNKQKTDFIDVFFFFFSESTCDPALRQTFPQLCCNEKRSYVNEMRTCSRFKSRTEKKCIVDQNNCIEMRPFHGKGVIPMQ